LDRQALAKQTHGFVGADLAALAREAGIRALRRYLPEIDLEEEEIPASVLETMVVTAADFRDALRDVSPSAMREVMLEVSHVTWQDVGGLDEAKQEIREAVEYPLTQRERYEELGIRPPRGVLLYGPPGTGKTLIAKAVANESGANFIAIRGPQLLSKWVGESERAVREIFKKARQVAPAIIFFDELDALAPTRGSDVGTHVMESVLNQILTEIDGLQELKDVVVLGATNQPLLVDPALLRPGRFDRLVYIGEPNLADRKKILAIHMRGMPIEGSAMGDLVERLRPLGEEGIDAVCEELGRDREVTPGEVIYVSEKVKPSGKPPLSRAECRRYFVEQLSARNLRVVDPAVDTLIAELAARTEGYVGSDIEALCREAGVFAMREGVSAVGKRHFEASLSKVHPTMNPHLKEYYERIRQSFKGGLPREVQLPEYQ
ncbi:MAG: AAA family ATPase, partial [Methanolinea sp.]